MSIASEITRIQGNISDAYTAASAKGATLPATQNSDNLATTISTISGGGVDTTGWIPKAIDANGKLVGSSTAPNFTSAQDIGDYALYYAFYRNTALTGAVSFPALTTISGTNGMNSAFYGCTGLTSVDLSALTTISGSSGVNSAFRDCTGLTSVGLSALTTISGTNGMNSAFRGCTNLTSVDLSALTTISGSNGMNNAFSDTGLTSVSLPLLTTISGSSAMYYAFYGCTNLTSASFPLLTTISGTNGMADAFYGCTNLTSVDLSALTTISGSSAMYYAFEGCTGLTSVSFPALNSNSFGTTYRSQFGSMLSGVTGCTIHFPSNLDPQSGSTVISNLSGYPYFGGTNTVLAFDLPATE